jgi:hypothetical protein
MAADPDPALPPAVTLRPGRRLVVAAALAMAAGLPGFLIPGWGWVVAAAAVAVSLLAVGDARAATRRVAGVRVRRTLPPIVGRGLEFTSTLLVDHDGSLPELVIRDVHPPDCLP